MKEPVTVDTEDRVAVVTLNRPAAFNAFDLDMMSAFSAALVSLATNPDVRGVVITGAGKAFCAGGNLKWALSFPHGVAAAFHELAARMHLGIIEIRRMAKPVIAAINGTAAGGGFSLALACDFRVMAESAVLKQAYTSSGLTMDGGGSFTLPRLVGFARALEIVAFDPTITASQALAWGLATRVVKDGAALASATDMARELSAKSLHAYGLCKRLLLEAFDTPFETHMEHERAAISSSGEHPEGQEGLRAFNEKRKPKFGP